MNRLTYCTRCENPALGLSNNLCIRCTQETTPDINFVAVSTAIINDRCKHFSHPIQFKILLREILSLFSELYPPQQRRNQIYASAMKFEILSLWSKHFKRRFSRSPFPSESYDGMERSMTPWVDWDSQDQRELEQAAVLQ